MQGTFDYLTERLRNELLTIYLPSLTSVLLVLVVLALFLFIPHPPTYLSDLWHPLSWWKDISADLGDKDGIPRFLRV